MLPKLAFLVSLPAVGLTAEEQRTYLASHTKAQERFEYYRVGACPTRHLFEVGRGSSTG